MDDVDPMSPDVHDRLAVSFSTSGDTLTIHDEIEERTLSVTADRQLSTQSALTALFQFPVDRAISFSAEELTVGADMSVWVRDETGDILTDVVDGEQSFSRGTYYLDIDSDVKTYVRLPDVEPTLTYEGKVCVSPLSIDLGTETTVTVGARSLHSRPGSTITVPDDPAAMMEAFSYLGSAIKEFSPERSWPTLRGHPPRIERGDELEIPDALQKPDTGITVTVPETYADVYRVAPLAFYFGATIEPGDDPAMHLSNGYTERLETPTASLEESVERLLSTCLVLDALARQDGYVPLTTREYADVGPHLSFYPETIVDEPLVEQLLEYLESPSEPVLAAAPTPPFTAVLRPDPADVTFIPHLLDSLSTIQVAAEPPTPTAGRSSVSSSTAVAYSHPSIPSGGLQLHESALERRFFRGSKPTPEARIGIVTSDSARAERIRECVDDAWTAIDSELVIVRASPSRQELHSLLTGEVDLLLSDLPSSEGRIVCADGPLDLDGVTDLSTAAVLLDERAATVEAATEFVDTDVSIAGTFPDATGKTGLAVARCMLSGQKLPWAANLLADDYRLVGNPETVIAHFEGQQAGYCCRVESNGPDTHGVVLESCPIPPMDIGSVVRLKESYSVDDYSLVGSPIEVGNQVPTSVVVDALAAEDIVVVLNGDVYAHVIEDGTELVEESARATLGATERDWDDGTTEFGASSDSNDSPPF